VSDRVRASVLVVDDEPATEEVVARYLERAGYEARVAPDGPAALEAAAERRVDLVVLDLMLPGIDGLEVMRRLRRGTGPAPAIILLTARGEESDRITGLRLGADDYVVKPFSPGELVARVDAVLRRAPAAEAEHEVLRAGDVVIDVGGRRVTRGGEEVALTVREFELLAFLARHPGQAFTREELMERVWRFSFYTDTSTVTVHVRRLRSKLEPDPDAPRLIETVWGVGYRFASQS
jgi:two-component system, OmpR family, response regulator ResD